MASTQYSTAPPTATGTAAPTTTTPQWYEQQHKAGEVRSVTPAMNNTRGALSNPTRGGPGTYPSRVPSPTPAMQQNGAAPLPQGQSRVAAHYGQAGGRYNGGYNATSDTMQGNAAAPSAVPSSTGLIRLTLKKPMGIVFEPMYDPNQPSLQRGVRICDLPRTGAAALSRKLEVGDELLSINDKTMSRLTFDEIMDFIIEADPEKVNLLFRRPRKETLAARAYPKASSSTNNGVKWVDDDVRKKTTDEKPSSTPSGKSKRPSRRDDDDTLVSEDVDRDPKSSRRKRGRRHFQNDSFLDLLIDTLCTDTMCRPRDRKDDESYYDDPEDDWTYETYESDKNKRGNREESSVDTEDDTYISEDDRRINITKEEEKMLPSKLKGKKKPKDETIQEDPEEEQKRNDSHKKKPYDDDATLETTETTDRPVGTKSTPLGLTPSTPSSAIPKSGNVKSEPLTPVRPQVEQEVPQSEDEVNPAPIKEVEYDDGVDHGADVSVMESLGGPSLLIEKQRQAALAKTEDIVPAEIMDNFGLDYPIEFGLTREQTIQKDPLSFHTFVVKGLLEKHEPEKVRLLDKLLTKYKGREDHLIQKLSVRYKHNEESHQTPTIPEEEANGFGAFTEAVNIKKESPATAAAIEVAERAAEEQFGQWPKEEEVQPDGGEGSASESGSEFSGDSIDGTSPAVIAQVSELLNYVYGKTSVPGQIDRVSTIMRAYEGREAVLLELLETKALIKANSEKENAANLPAFLQGSTALQNNIDTDVDEQGVEPVSPLSNPHMPNHQPGGTGTFIIGDAISDMSGPPAPPVLDERNDIGVDGSNPENGVIDSMRNNMSSPKPSFTLKPNMPTAKESAPPKRFQQSPPRSASTGKKRNFIRNLFGKGNKSKAKNGANGKKSKNKSKLNSSHDGSI